jgi:hypothetical protein
VQSLKLAGQIKTASADDNNDDEQSHVHKICVVFDIRQTLQRVPSVLTLRGHCACVHACQCSDLHSVHIYVQCLAYYLHKASHLSRLPAHQRADILCPMFSLRVMLDGWTSSWHALVQCILYILSPAALPSLLFGAFCLPATHVTLPLHGL